MQTKLDDAETSLLVVNQVQTDLHRIMAELRKIRETAGLEGWSPEIGQHYRISLDDLAALDMYIHIFKQTFLSRSTGDGSSADGATSER